MSWSLRIAARTPLSAADEVDQDRYIPPGFKAAIREALTRLRLDHRDIVVVRTQGHLGDGWGRAEIDVSVVELRGGG